MDRESSTTDTTERYGRTKRVLGIAIAALLLLPALARTLGVEPRAIENRRLASLPDLGIADLLFSPNTIDALERYAIDHLALRSQVVAARSRLVLEVLPGEAYTSDLANWAEARVFNAESIEYPQGSPGKGDPKKE